MESFCHWLTELDEVYARHAARHGPNRLLPRRCSPRTGACQGMLDPPRKALLPMRAWRSLPHRKSAHNAD